jgi:hypothetical protein
MSVHALSAQIFQCRRSLKSTSRAALFLEAQPIRDPTEEMCHALQALPPPEPIPPSPTLPLQLSLGRCEVRKSQKPHKSAAGSGGWACKHVKVATSSSKDPGSTVLRFVQAGVCTDLPHLPRFFDAHLLPFASHPPDPTHRRVWYRLAALYALAACPEASQTLSPLQVAFGVCGGSQVVRHAAPASIAVQNAFNTLCRDKMLAAVEQQFAALLSMVVWAYGQHSHLLVQQFSGVLASLQSWVQQGNPLGQLLFALTMQRPLEEVETMDLAQPLPYAVHTFLQGAPAPTMQAFAALTALAAPLGLDAQPAMCATYSADGAAAILVASLMGVNHLPHGLLAAGTPVGTPAFQTAHANSCASCACFLMKELLALPVGDKDCWLILHGSLQKRVAHISRGSGWEQVGPAVQIAESKAVDCPFAIKAHPRSDGPLTDQATLSLPHGRLGLARTNPAEGDAAYLAAATTTQLAVREGPAAFRTLDGPSSEQLCLLWVTLHNTAVGL